VSQPLIEVVIPVHTLDRPIARAVASVIDEADANDVRALVVAHGIAGDDVRALLAELPGDQVQVLEFADGVRSASGPANFGLAHATGEYVMRMDSDDWLEPGFARAYIAYLRKHPSTDVLIPPMRTSGGQYLPVALPSWARSRDLRVTNDRLLYRTQPFALVNRELLMSAGFLYREGMATGEDLALGIWVWTHGQHIAMDRNLPAYVYTTDGVDRLTAQKYTFREMTDPLYDLLAMPWVSGLSRAIKRSLAIKYVRVAVLPTLRGLDASSAWASEDVARVRELVATLQSLSPGFTSRMSRDEARAIAQLAAVASCEQLILVGRSLGRSSWAGRNITANPWFSLSYESLWRRPFEFAWVRVRRAVLRRY